MVEEVEIMGSAGAVTAETMATAANWYTQRSIADHLGVHSTWVSRVLCGHHKR